MPDRLYNLEIRQYDPSGNYLAGNDYGTVNIGEQLTATLAKSDNCQLVLIARGNGARQADFALGSQTIEKIESMSIESSVINAIDPTNADAINAMPYVLHLKNVKVVQDADGRFVIQSPEGAYDTRLLLKRLATRLTVTWKYNVSGYTLKQLLIQSIPLNYTIIDSPDANNTYPSIVSQFTTLAVPIDAGKAASGTYSCWVPANVRGESVAASTDLQRTKANAPVGSAYLNFVAVNNDDLKKKLDYRVYVGSGSSMDFNMYRNKNYNYTVNFSHTGIPIDDKRVTYIDPIPASVNNDNLVPTANCFMIEPGGAFCFNPYKYYVNGSETDNKLLQKWSAVNKINSVKVLWQTRENGDVGEPVLGIVNSTDDHTNIVELANGDDVSNARIYCRVAPDTSGGSGLIAAYDAGGNVLWSWHIWVTDYNPDPTGNMDVQTPVNKRKQKYAGGQYPIMDRNLGAVAGYTVVPKDELDRSKANGFMYQWGRKDPFRSSYTNRILSSIDIPDLIDSPLDGILSCYQGDGISFASLTINKEEYVTYQIAYQNPETLYKPASKNNVEVQWISQDERGDDYYNSWGQDGDKGLHDPCPSGWRVTKKDDFYPLYSQPDTEGTLNLVLGNEANADGGYLVYYDANEKVSAKSSYFRLTGYWMGIWFGEIGTFGYWWTRDNSKSSAGKGGYPLRLKANSQSWAMAVGGHEQEALLIRCIQERE